MVSSFRCLLSLDGENFFFCSLFLTYEAVIFFFVTAILLLLMRIYNLHAAQQTHFNLRALHMVRVQSFPFCPSDPQPPPNANKFFSIPLS